MNIPPYFPEAIEIPGNVSEERYAVRLRFIRQVIALHFGTVLAVFAVAFLRPLPIHPTAAAMWLVASLLAMSAIRQFHLARPEWDARLSSLLLPVVLSLCGVALGGLAGAGWPWEGVAGAALGWVAYACLCGRDFSFLGLGFVASIGALIGAVVGWTLERYGIAGILRGSLFGLAVAFYFVYDLSAMLTRRRKQDVVAAVADLYRDVLNVLSYSVRVYRHWKKYPFRAL